MPQRVLVDGLNYRSSPQTEQELLHDLADIDERARKDAEPLIATLYFDADGDDTPFLSLALGTDESLLVYSSGGRNDESGFSRGARADDDTVVEYRYGTAINEYLGWMLIPKAAAYAAAEEFFRTGRQPTNVEWGDL
jgi:hypothetical protein